jgi:hypothetical protein
MEMLRTADINMADTVNKSDIADFLTKATWTVHSMQHTVHKSSPCTAVFGRDMLFDIPFLGDWNKIGDYRQCQTDQNTAHENKTYVDWDYKVGDKELKRKDGILCKTESRYDNDHWTIMSVHMNGTLRVQCRTKSEGLTIRRVTPYLGHGFYGPENKQLARESNNPGLIKRSCYTAWGSNRGQTYHKECCLHVEHDEY